jgi:DNA processing protein
MNTLEPRSRPEPIDIVTPEELGFEERLRPARARSLHVRGSVLALEPPLVAIVGTRQPDGEGLAMARLLAERCASRGITVVSGGALGIDAAAHLGCVDRRGRTVAVLPCGIDRPYPLRHRPLYDRICALGGALVSQFDVGTPPTRWTFPKRNALVAALCDVLVLVQAPSSSGALLTASLARNFGRRVLVVPAGPGDRRGAGCLTLLRAGAAMCEGPEDLFSALDRSEGPLWSARPPKVPSPKRPTSVAAPTELGPRNSPAPRETSRPAPTLDPAQSRCLDALGSKPLHPDALSSAAGLSSAQVRSALVTLTLLGLVDERSDGTFIRC